MSLPNAGPAITSPYGFAVLDQEGVGKLIEQAVKLGRGTRKDLEIGICGEHGGEPNSVMFCLLKVELWA